jgi:hypothetical protein
MIPHYLGPWMRGVNYALPAEELSANDIFSMENMVVGVGGEVFQRPGFAPYITAQANGSSTLTGVGRQKFSAASSANFCIAGNKFLEDVSGTWTDRTNSETITAGDGNVWDFANANGVLVGVNGVSGDAILHWSASGNLTSGGLTGQQVSWATWAEWWDGRVWLGNSNRGTDRTYYTSNTSITSSSANDWLGVGEPLTGQKKFSDQALALHGENTIQLLVPTNNASIPYRRVGRSSRGTVAGRSIVTVAAPGIPQMQLFVRQDGIYRFTGGEAEKISWKLDGERFWDNVKSNSLTDAFAATNTDRNEVWFFLPYGTSQTKFNRIIVYNYLRDIWYGPHVVNSALYGTFNCAADISGVIHAGGYNDSGRLYKMDFTSALNDDQDGTTTSAINATFTTGAPHPSGPDVMNRYLHLRSAYDVMGDYQVNATHFAPGIPADTESFGQGGDFDAVESAFKIGTSRIAGELLQASIDTDLNGYDPTIQITYSNGSGNEEFSMRRATVMYRPLKRIRKVNAGVY